MYHVFQMKNKQLTVLISTSSNLYTKHNVYQTNYHICINIIHICTLYSCTFRYTLNKCNGRLPMAFNAPACLDGYRTFARSSC